MVRPTTMRPDVRSESICSRQLHAFPWRERTPLFIHHMRAGDADARSRASRPSASRPSRDGGLSRDTSRAPVVLLAEPCNAYTSSIAAVTPGARRRRSDTDGDTLGSWLVKAGFLEAPEYPSIVMNTLFLSGSRAASGSAAHARADDESWLFLNHICDIISPLRIFPSRPFG